MCSALFCWAHMDTAVCSPDMAQEQTNGSIVQLQQLSRQTFLMRALPKHAQPLQPRTDTCRVPAVAIATNHQLVPLPASRHTPHGRTHRLGCGSHCQTVVLAGGGIAHRLTAQITAIAHQMGQQDQRVFRPRSATGWLRNLARQGQTIAGLECL